MRLETAIGEQLQLDWVEFRKGGAPLHAFCATVARWLREVANEPVHGATLEKPAVRMAAEMRHLRRWRRRRSTRWRSMNNC